MIIAAENQAFVQHVKGEVERDLKVLLSPALNEGLDQLAVGLTIIPPGSQSDKTGHVEGELFYVLEGTGAIEVEGEKAPVSKGTTVFAPPYAIHQLINNSGESLKILWVLCPPGREKAIIEQGKIEP